MAKRYNEQEKRDLVSSYLASGRSCAAYARSCGISAVTLKSWQLRFSEAHPSGFVAISGPSDEREYGFRLRVGDTELLFDRLPPADWMSSVLKLMGE
jgi:transposase-like protein